MSANGLEVKRTGFETAYVNPTQNTIPDGVINPEDTPEPETKVDGEIVANIPTDSKE